MSDSDELDAMQALFLWRLIFDQGEGWIKDLKPELDAQARKDLEARGFIQVEKRTTGDPRRKANYAKLLDQSWNWAQQHLDHPLPARSPAGCLVLRQVLTRLQSRIARGELSLAEFCSAGDAGAPPDVPSPDLPMVDLAWSDDSEMPLDEQESAADLKRQIVAACQQLTAGAYSGRVRLSDLRAKFSEVPRPQMDEALRDMEAADAIVVYPLDNPREITDSDVEASLPNSSNNQRHIVYLKR